MESDDGHESDAGASLEIGRAMIYGEITDVRLYNASLSASEIATLAENILPNQARTTNLGSHWKLDETTGTSAVNSGTGGNAGAHSGTPSTLTKIGNRATALAGLYNLRFRGASHTQIVPAFTTPRLKVETGGMTVKATGDMTITSQLQVSSAQTFNVNGNTINSAEIDVNGTGTLNITNSTLNFTTAGIEWNMQANSILTAGPTTTVTGYSSSNPTDIKLPDTGEDTTASNFEIVGNISNLDAKGLTDLTVIGTVTDCVITGTAPNIHQWHHTLDTQQLLDADSAGDDDMKLTKPSLDNALQLQTGG